MYPDALLQRVFPCCRRLLPWNITPMLGLITDTWPILGYHRKGYLLVVGLTGEYVR